MFQRCFTLLAASAMLHCIAATAEPSGEVFFAQGEGFEGWGDDTGDWVNIGAAAMDLQEDTLLTTVPGSGVLVNGDLGRTRHLVSEFRHGDVHLQVEFMIPKGSNSGISFQGRYEIQIVDSWSEEIPYKGECAGIYARYDEAARGGTEWHPPRVNASLPPGEWQSLDIEFQAPRFDFLGNKIANAKFLRIEHNSVLVHENVEVGWPAEPTAWPAEKPTGLLILQGDHGPVAFRNLVITPLH